MPDVVTQRGVGPDGERPIRRKSPPIRHKIDHRVHAQVRNGHIADEQDRPNTV
jgi:hypothetical protein